jgi:hypothetical protein
VVGESPSKLFKKGTEPTVDVEDGGESHQVRDRPDWEIIAKAKSKEELIAGRQLGKGPVHRRPALLFLDPVGWVVVRGEERVRIGDLSSEIDQSATERSGAVGRAGGTIGPAELASIEVQAEAPGYDGEPGRKRALAVYVVGPEPAAVIRGQLLHHMAVAIHAGVVIPPERCRRLEQEPVVASQKGRPGLAAIVRVRALEEPGQFWWDAGSHSPKAESPNLAGGSP